MGDRIRLDKFLSEMTKETRSQIKEAAKKGRIRVNGEVEKKSERKIDPSADTVCFDGIEIAYTSMEYYMLNKPQGVVSATEDNLHRTVIELIKTRKREDLFPVGRLDIDTEGLLLITNDGPLAHCLLAPKKHVDKCYYVKIEGSLPNDAKQQFELGIILKDGTKTMPADLEMLNREEMKLTIREGKFHQVKRMFEALDCRVTYLKRLSMGPLVLDEGLRPGEYRPLTAGEIERLKDREDGKREGRDYI